jgi:PhzF family phenazine biosynthesis protein
MQQVAAEMNVSETAFFYPDATALHLRWFTPTTEVDLCGHATLASAHVLRELGLTAIGSTVRFQTASGLLTVAVEQDWLHMDFPAEHAEPVDTPQALIDGLGVTPLWVGRNRLDFVAELESADAVRDLTPDLRPLAQLPGRGVIVTARGPAPANATSAEAIATPDEVDYVCRVFGPKAGIPEDPATGSAQCALGPYWAAKLGKPELRVHQVSKRGGAMRVRTAGARVIISGQAVTTSAGDLLR